MSQQVDGTESFPVCTTPFRASDFITDPDFTTAVSGALIRFPPNQQITVLPHVQAYADAAQEATGVSSWGTYIGHQPTPPRATDAFTTKEEGDALCEWALRRENWKRYGLRYLMWWHHINYNDGRGWLWVAERGSWTANHMDHVHNAHEDTAPEQPEEDFLASLSEDEQREMLGLSRSTNDNTKNIGAIVLHELGDGNWEVGAKRLADAVKLIEQIAKKRK